MFNVNKEIVTIKFTLNKNYKIIPLLRTILM